MAERPIFIPCRDKVRVHAEAVSFTWFAGFAPSQKHKSVASLHAAARVKGFAPLLEISSKGTELGQRFSAFNLRYVRDADDESYPVENIFQGSKVFTNGGAYADIYDKEPLAAKKDERLKTSGELVKFSCFGEDFPLRPPSFFYDWIYINALRQDTDLSAHLLEFQGFTDIEFNPDKSLNCQAYSAALYVSLCENGALDAALESREAFLESVGEEYEKRILQIKPIGKPTRNKRQQPRARAPHKRGQGA